MIIYNIFISQKSQIKIPKVVPNHSGFLRLGSNKRSFRYSYFVCFMVVGKLGCKRYSSLQVGWNLSRFHGIGSDVLCFFPRGSCCHYSTLICLNIRCFVLEEISAFPILVAWKTSSETHGFSPAARQQKDLREVAFAEALPSSRVYMGGFFFNPRNWSCICCQNGQLGGGFQHSFTSSLSKFGGNDPIWRAHISF